MLTDGGDFAAAEPLLAASGRRRTAGWPSPCRCWHIPDSTFAPGMISMRCMRGFARALPRAGPAGRRIPFICWPCRPRRPCSRRPRGAGQRRSRPPMPACRLIGDARRSAARRLRLLGFPRPCACLPGHRGLGAARPAAGDALCVRPAAAGRLAATDAHRPGLRRLSRHARGLGRGRRAPDPPRRHRRARGP